ncbi:MAG TPA: hypothetical protein VN375_08490, partial [Vicinamibacteria bacterium]|nr:hypothetical protein [Vicinamibacteria bacterium]
LEPTGTPSTQLPGEAEDFIWAAWMTATKGTTPAECQSILGTDSYRVRRLLAHWVEEGALKARPAAPSGTGG